MNIKKAYYYFYYKLYNFFILFGEDFLNKYKPVIFIIFLEILLLFAFSNWYSILARGWDNEDHTILYFAIGIFISLFNSAFYLHGDKYKKHFIEFENYSKQKKILAGWITFIIITMVFAAYIFSDHQMSLIDWKKYR